MTAPAYRPVLAGVLRRSVRFLRRAAETQPVRWDEQFQMWLVTRYDDVNTIDPHSTDLFSNDSAATAGRRSAGSAGGRRAAPFVNRLPRRGIHPDGPARAYGQAHSRSPHGSRPARWSRSARWFAPVVDAALRRRSSTTAGRTCRRYRTSPAAPRDQRADGQCSARSGAAIAEQARKRMASVLSLDDRSDGGRRRGLRRDGRTARTRDRRAAGAGLPGA